MSSAKLRLESENWVRLRMRERKWRLLEVERVMELGVWGESDGAELVRVVAYQKRRQVLDVSRRSH